LAKQVSVIIINWNGLHHLEKCLPAVFAQTFADFDVILVDNGSDDGSVEWVLVRFPQVRLLRNTQNVGFAEGNNQAIRVTDAEYIVTLNNDARVEPGWLAALVEVVTSDPTVGMVASKMLFADQPNMINSAGIALDPVGIAWDRLGGMSDNPDERTPTEVFGPCAGAALYRRTMLNQIGLFDKDFFAYMEDVDLAWRARLAGFRCLYAPKARVYHAHSATGVEGSPFKSRLLGRNKIWLIAKNYGPGTRLLTYLPLVVLYDLMAVIFAVITRGDVYSLLGRIDGIIGLPLVWCKRHAIQVLSRSNRASPWYHHLEPLVWPWQIPQRYRHITPITQGSTETESSK
jgi:GT2 family glycosyltransferase